jgi:WD40 repeat protein
MVASSSNDRNVVLWSVKTMKKVGLIGDQSAVGSPITFTGDGKFLITTNINDSLQINSISPSQGVPTKAPVKRRRR